MALKAAFQVGATTTTTESLHQWDYGQQLEIEHPDLPTVVEAHFACPDMSEAIVRPCSSTAGIATTMIPDRCLEQTSPITVWVFVINGTEGMTKLTITIPVEKRTRPAPVSDIPVDFVNRYAELLTEINEAVVGLQNGDIVAAKALTASSANTAGTAGHAYTADQASSSYITHRAYTADEVNLDWKSLYAGDLDVAYQNQIYRWLEPQKMYLFNVKLRTSDFVFHQDYTFVLTVGNGKYSESTASVFSGSINGRSRYGLIRLLYDYDDEYLWLRATSFEAHQDFGVSIPLYAEISYCQLGVSAIPEEV